MLQLLYFIAVSKKIIEQESVVVRRNGEYCVYLSLIPNTITITNISLQLYCDIILAHFRILQYEVPTNSVRIS